MRVLVFYFPDLAATTRGNLNNFSFFHLVSMGNHQKLSGEFFDFSSNYIKSAAEINLKNKKIIIIIKKINQISFKNMCFNK